MPLLDPIASPPPGRARVLASAFIGVWLCGQVILPLFYSLGDDPADERFAWRMFSDITAYQRYCSVTLTEMVDAPGSAAGAAPRELDIARVLHPAWEVYLRRARGAVVDKFLRRRCESDATVTEIEFRRTCRLEAASRMPPVERRLTCRTGGLPDAGR